MLFFLLLVVGIVSAADIDSADDTLKIDENIGSEIVEVYSEEALEEGQQSIVTVKFINEVTGEEYGSQTNTISEGGSWGMGMAKFNNMIANHKTFKLDGYKYTFTHWSGENGIVEGTQRFYCTGEDYTVAYYAHYDRELLGRLTFIVNDEHGHNGHTMTYNDEADYRFTFKDPVDVEEGYEFLYYEDAETGEIYNPGDIFAMAYSEFQGQDMTVTINAIYEKIVENDTENETSVDNNQTNENETAIDNGTAENQSENGTVIDDGDETINSDIIIGNDGDNSTSNNLTGILSNHKTGIVFTALVVLVVAVIGISLYHRRREY